MKSEQNNSFYISTRNRQYHEITPKAVYCVYSGRVFRSGGSGVNIEGGDSGVAIIAAGGGTDLYCHSKPPLASDKLCFIINFIGATGGAGFLLGGGARWPFEPPLVFRKRVVGASKSLPHSGILRVQM